MSEWISIKDKLPDKDGRYLVVENWVSDSFWIGVCSLRNGKWDTTHITHWQELPELPE
jgi:hypothetical protein